MFGFLERLPWKIGGKGGRRYRPSAADMQDRPGQSREGVAEPFLEENEEEAESGPVDKNGKRNRKRSNTSGSGETLDSLSSRGDLFPSDDEADAVALDDEFAMVLERRTTNSAADDASSRRHRGKRPSESRNSTKTVSTRGKRKSSNKSRRSSVSVSDAESKRAAGRVEDVMSVPSITDLRGEEERAREEEEEAVERKRIAAKKLALKRGLSLENLQQVSHFLTLLIFGVKLTIHSLQCTRRCRIRLQSQMMRCPRRHSLR
jgi:hypothetical protein